MAGQFNSSLAKDHNQNFQKTGANYAGLEFFFFFAQDMQDLDFDFKQTTLVELFLFCGPQTNLISRYEMVVSLEISFN